jgi:tetrapyrrole methylase family protein/MazG family protein
LKSFDHLLRVMAKLRSAQGCPWDRKQTHRSLIHYLFEEARELQNSIRKKNYKNMEEELGDVLLQVIFHAQLAQEKGRFTIDDVIRHLLRKLILRHPHVFGYTHDHRRLLGKKRFRTSQDVLAQWDTLKKISNRAS